MLKLGAHFSIAGGHHNAVLEAALLKCTVVQIFTKNQTRWDGKPLTDEGIDLFRSERKRLGIEVVLSHDSYLINLGSPDSILWERSIYALIDEIERATHLDIDYLVFHPGSHVGSGEGECIDRIAQALNRTFETHADNNLTLLLETTAGQGTNVGYRFEHLAEIIEKVRLKEKLGVCFDTAHVFASGYELRTREGYEETWNEFDRIIGLEKLKAFHLNDSKKDFGTRVDRHEHIGQGYLGKKPFEYILNDERFDGLAGCLETPKEGDWDRRNLLTLRRLGNMPAAKKTTAKKKPAAKKRAGCGPKKVTAKKSKARATAKKKTVRKKVTAKKTVKKKSTAKRKPAAKKKVTKKAPARKKATAKRKPAAKKKVTKKKAPARKKTTAKRKPAAKKKVTKKKATRKKAPARKKVTARKPTTRKVARKK